ncbi:MAG: hypothetical protein FWC40_06865, partial [Proteobacteria bacterium]|nr:hypothetical protein [Pseudomonadota bacterium]
MRRSGFRTNPWLVGCSLMVVALGVWGCPDDSIREKEPDGELSKKGESCGKTQDCQEGLVCHEGRCHSVAVMGGDCRGEYVLCKEGVCREGQCREPLRGCASKGDCEENETCIEGSCYREVVLGGACDADSICLEGECSESGQCRKTAEVGGACGPYVDCVEGQVCSKSGTCIYLPSLGDDCTDEDGCGDDSLCMDGLCTRTDIPVGGACDNVSTFCEWSLGLTCVDGICRGSSSVGDACDANHLCSGQSVCIGGKCVENRGECESDDDCRGDSYCCIMAGCDVTEVCIPYGEGPRGDVDETCQYKTVPGLFEAAIQCEWKQPAPGDLYPNHANVLSTTFVVNTPHDSGTSNEIVFVTYNNSDGGTDSGEGTSINFYGVIRIIHGDTCELHESIFDDNNRIVGGSNLAIADVDGDGWPEIFASRGRAQRAGIGINGIVAFRWDDAQKKYVTWWSTPSEAQLQWGGPAVHDLDNNGRPSVIGANGAVFDALDGRRRNPGQTFAAPKFPILADLDGDGKIELIAGPTIYRWNSDTERWDEAYTGLPLGAGNHYAIADFGTENEDGTFDFEKLDGRAEIVMSGGNVVRIVTLSGKTLMNVAGLSGGGPPTVGDFDGDGLPEVATAFGDFFRIFKPGCKAGVGGCLRDSILWEQASQDLSSASTGSSLFDFDGDGKMEAVYADECYTRVYDGATGDVLFSAYRSSATWHEMPVIADVSNDQSAKIIIGSNNSMNCASPDPIHRGLRCVEDEDCFSGVCKGGLCRCTSSAQCNWRRDMAGNVLDEYGCVQGLTAADRVDGNVCRAIRRNAERVTGVRVMRDSLNRWVSSRNIWNQHAYSITNINDDMTIPRTSDWIQNFLVAGLNNYRQNSQGLSGMNAAPDITGRFVGDACGRKGDAVILGAEICNRGTKMLSSLMPATFYRIEDDGSRTKLCTSYTSAIVPVGGCLRVTCEIDNVILGDVVLVANDDGYGG